MRIFLLIEQIFPVVIILFCSKQDVEAIKTTASTKDADEDIVYVDADTEMRIVGGTTAFISQYPFLVSIQHIGGGHFCGGSILSEIWILTAAHCICKKGSVDRRPPSYFQVVVGLTYCDEYQTKMGSTYMVYAVYAHENYTRVPVRHDIGIMRLKKAIEFSERVKTVNLAMPKQYDPPDQYFNECIVAGWGYTSEDENKTNELQKVTLPIVSNADCNNAFGGDNVDEWQMCTLFESGGKDACFGDSGGPLFCSGNIQVGVVSWGIGCARVNSPGVYSKVTPYIEWLNSTRFKNSSESLLTSLLRTFIIFIFNIVILLTFCDFN